MSFLFHFDVYSSGKSSKIQEVVVFLDMRHSLISTPISLMW